MAEAQISMLVHRDVFAKMDSAFREPLQQLLGTHLFYQFCALNRDAVAHDMAQLDPDNENFSKLSRDMRLVWRLWTDLLRLAEELNPQNQSLE